MGRYLVYRDSHISGNRDRKIVYFFRVTVNFFNS